MSVGHFKEGRVWRYSHAMVYGLLAGIIVLIVLRVTAAYVLEWYVNNKLDESPDYAGQVGDVDLMVLRGAYRIDNVEIIKTTGDVPVPLFAARKVEFSLLWRALFNGAAVGEAELFDPQINIVDSEDESKKQTGEGGKWLSIIDDLFPLRIDRAVIHNGQMHFRNFDAEPRMDIFLSEMELEALNLSNRQALTDSPIAQVKLAARAMQVSDLTVAAAFDPGTEKPTFDINAKLVQLPILELDNFIRSYAPFDVEAGTLDVVSEMAARDGEMVGYVKPIIYGLDVFQWKEDIQKDGDNPLRALWEALVGGVAELLQNQEHDQLASYIPLQGDVSDPDTNVFVAVAGILKNAFVEAYRANLENTVSLFIRDDELEEQVTLPAPLSEEDLKPQLSARQQVKENEQQADVHNAVAEEVQAEQLQADTDQTDTDQAGKDQAQQVQTEPEPANVTEELAKKNGR